MAWSQNQVASSNIIDSQINPRMIYFTYKRKTLRNLIITVTLSLCAIRLVAQVRLEAVCKKLLGRFEHSSVKAGVDVYKAKHQTIIGK